MDISIFAGLIVGRVLSSAAGRFYVSTDGEESGVPNCLWLAFDASPEQVFELNTRGDGGLEITEAGPIPTAVIDMQEMGFLLTRSIGGIEALLGRQLSAVRLLRAPIDGVVGFSADTSDGATLWVVNLGDDLHLGVGNPVAALAGADITMCASN